MLQVEMALSVWNFILSWHSVWKLLHSRMWYNVVW